MGIPLQLAHSKYASKTRNDHQSPRIHVAYIHAYVLAWISANRICIEYSRTSKGIAFDVAIKCRVYQKHDGTNRWVADEGSRTNVERDGNQHDNVHHERM